MMTTTKMRLRNSYESSKRLNEKEQRRRRSSSVIPSLSLSTLYSLSHLLQERERAAVDQTSREEEIASGK